MMEKWIVITWVVKMGILAPYQTGVSETGVPVIEYREYEQVHYREFLTRDPLKAFNLVSKLKKEKAEFHNDQYKSSYGDVLTGYKGKEGIVKTRWKLEADPMFQITPIGKIENIQVKDTLIPTLYPPNSDRNFKIR